MYESFRLIKLHKADSHLYLLNSRQVLYKYIWHQYNIYGITPEAYYLEKNNLLTQFIIINRVQISNYLHDRVKIYIFNMLMASKFKQTYIQEINTINVLTSKNIFFLHF